MSQSQQEHSPTSALTELSISLPPVLAAPGPAPPAHTNRGQTHQGCTNHRAAASSLFPMNSLISSPQNSPFSLQRELNWFLNQGKSSTLLWVGGWSVPSQALICLAHAELGGGR